MGPSVRASSSGRLSLSAYLPVPTSVGDCRCMSVCPSVVLSVCVTVRLSVRLSVCMCLPSRGTVTVCLADITPGSQSPQNLGVTGKSL
jgi:hypothetical protein